MTGTSAEILHIVLIPRQASLHLPRALRDELGGKYDTDAQLIVKWIVGPSVKGQAQFPVDISAGVTTQQVLISIIPDDAPAAVPPTSSIIFDSAMNRKQPPRSHLYRKKLMEMTLRLSVKKRRDKVATIFNIACCQTDLRDLMPSPTTARDSAAFGAHANCVRLCMDRTGDYMDVHCTVSPARSSSFCSSSSPALSSSMFLSQSALGAGMPFGRPGSRRPSAMPAANAAAQGAKAPHVASRTPDLAHECASSCAITDSPTRTLSRCSHGGDSGDAGARSDTTGFFGTSAHTAAGPFHFFFPTAAAAANNNSTINDSSSTLANTMLSTMDDHLLTMAPMPAGDISSTYEFCDAETTWAAEHYVSSALANSTPLHRLFHTPTCEQQFTITDALSLFAALFPRRPPAPALRAAALMAAMHSGRRNTNYTEVPQFADVAPAHPHTAFYTTTYNLRFSGDKYMAAEEYAVIVAARDRVIVHAVHIAPSAPLVGSSARLEVGVEIITGGLVRVAILPVVSGWAQSLLRNKITAQQRKAEKCMRAALHEAAAAIGAAFAAPRAVVQPHGHHHTPASVTLPSSSIDPSLWRRLRDADTLANPALVEDTLRHMAQAPLPSLRMTESYIQTLEQCVVLHRTSPVIVRHVTASLLRLAGGRGVDGIVAVAPTLGTTLRQIYAMHKPETLFPTHAGDVTAAEAARLLTQLDARDDARHEQRRRELSSARDLWHVLGIGVSDRREAADILRRMRAQRVVLTERQQCRLLHAALVLHMDCPAVARAVLGMVLCSYTRSPLLAGLRSISADFVTALRRALALYRSALIADTAQGTSAAAWDAFEAALSKREAELTDFERHFGSALAEEPCFTCTVRLIGARDAWHCAFAPDGDLEECDSVPLAVTPSFFCLGHVAMPLSRVRRVRRFRHWWLLPAVQLFFLDGGDAAGSWGSASVAGERTQRGEMQEVAFTMWRRDDFVAVLQQLNSFVKVDD